MADGVGGVGGGGLVVVNEAAVFAEEGAAGEVAGVAVVELEVGVEVDGGSADGGDGEGVGGAVVVALDVAVGEAMTVAAGDLLGEGGGGGWIAAVGVAGGVVGLLR